MSIRQATFKTIMNTKMAEETPLNKIEILRVEIDSKTTIDMILKTLPNSFRQFKLNYFMSKI